MKKVFSLMLLMTSIMCFTACSGDEDDFPATYTIWCNTELGGYSNEVRIFEYNDKGDKIYDRIINNVKQGSKYTYTASTDDVEKVKVYISVESVFNSRSGWVQRVFYLNKNKNTDIFLESNTVIGSKEP